MRKTRGISVILIVLLMLTALPVAPALASTNARRSDVASFRPTIGITPFYTIISSIHGTCYISGGKIYVSGTVSSGGVSDSAKVTVVLQANSGSGWKAAKTWTGSGTTSATVMGSYTAKSGVIYRAKITGTVTKGSASESDTITSDGVSL